MAYWLLKTEPSTFSFADLQNAKTSPWDGVTNATALIHLSTMHPGDHAVIYHTGDEKQAVGLATISSAPYADPKQHNPKRVVVDVTAKSPLPNPVPLATLKTDKTFADSPLLRIGRLSVVPLTAAQWAAILKHARV